MEQNIYRKTSDLRGLADIRLVVLDDGPGRGQRVLIARNGAGISFEVAVDRSFDLSHLSAHGVNLGWNSVNQMRFPSVPADSDEGWGFFQNFDGFLVTCGLEHYGRPTHIDGAIYKHPHHQQFLLPMHGKISALQGRLHGYGIDEERGVIWCKGSVRQVAVYGEALQLDRLIELPIEGNVITITDKVSNKGFQPTPHALLYHFNVGYPLLDESLVLSGVTDEFAAEFRKKPPIPHDDIAEMVDPITPVIQADGWSRVRVENPRLDKARGIEFGFLTSQLPELTIWRCYLSGIFALGIEPNIGVAVKDGAALDSHLLAPGEVRPYHLQLRLL